MRHTTRIKACVFDAYGTLFDVHSVSARAEALAPTHGADLSRLWRAKQLEYTWLASLMSGPGYARPDFHEVTAMALDYAVAALVLPIDADARADLAREYERLAPYADAATALESLAPLPRWILSNGTRAMLDPLVRASRLAEVLDGVISVDEAGVYKPSPRVYALAVERLSVEPETIAFVSANGWDAAGAQAFGMTAIWINRSVAPVERHAGAPAHVVGSLAEAVAVARAA
ncbi:2-haloacid dehalogenase [Burkholderiales bacterium]|nr:2-haloacid dehalogenase [Burkholderiales bacterium]